MRTLYQRVLLVGVLAALLTGCVAVALTPEQTRQLDEVKQFVTATATHYRLPNIYILLGTHNHAATATYRFGMITLDPRMLQARALWVLMAHELGHYVLGHERISATGYADYRQEIIQREMDANAKGVEILVRVRGLTEETAVRDFVAALLSAPQQGELHGPICNEVADLLRRYPVQRAAFTARGKVGRCVIK